jgi:hypothetical protein
MSKTPKGIVATFTDSTGHVVASVSDFDRSGYGGFTLQEAQRYRVRRKLAYAVLNAYCSPVIVKALSEYDCRAIIDKLTRESGFTETIIPIGYDEAA